MSKPYQRKTGDFEIRILPDGRIVFVAPDEALMELAQVLKQIENTEEPDKEKHCHAGRKADGGR